MQSTLRRPRWLPQRLRWRARIAIGLVLALAVAVPVAWASHDFIDVPTSHQFHTQISAIKGAGITRGCNAEGTMYCPDEFVRRDAMAAFMHRGYGRVGSNNGPVTLNSGGDGTFTTELSTTLTAGATGSGNGFALVQAQLGAWVAAEANCPCQIEIRIRNATTGAVGPLSFMHIGNVADEDGLAMDNGAVSAVFPLPAGATHQYDFQAGVDDSNASVSASVDMWAVYIPFSGGGDNTL